MTRPGGNGLPRRLRRFARHGGGSTGPVVGLLIFVAVGTAAVAVDTAVYYVQKRRLQSATDDAALSVVANAFQGTVAAGALRAYGFAPTALAVTPGVYDATGPLAARFTAAGQAANAVEVAATIRVPMMFGTVFGRTGGVAIAARSGATSRPVAAYAIGSRLAALNGGVANALLSALLGTQVSLSAMDYQALAGCNVDVGSFLTALGSRIGAAPESYASLLGTGVPIASVLAALAASAVDATSAAALNAVAAALPSGAGTVMLGSLIGLGPSGGATLGARLPAPLSVPAYGLLAGVAGLAGAGRTLSLDLGAQAPGLLGATLSLTLGPTAPSSVVAPANTVTVAATRQMQLALQTSVTVPGIGAVRLPLTLTVAKALATTQGPTCEQGAPQITLAVTPAAASLTLGALGTAPAPVATLLGLPVYASATIAAADATPQSEAFTAADVAAGTVKTVSASTPVRALLGSALGQAQVSVGAPGGPGQALGADPPLAAALATLGAPTASLIDQVTVALGVKVGQADTWVSALKCGVPVLIE